VAVTTIQKQHSANGSLSTRLLRSLSDSMPSIFLKKQRQSYFRGRNALKSKSSPAATTNPLR
jgi:hypothetical protein